MKNANPCHQYKTAGQDEEGAVVVLLVVALKATVALMDGLGLMQL